MSRYECIQDRAEVDTNIWAVVSTWDRVVDMNIAFWFAFPILEPWGSVSVLLRVANLGRGGKRTDEKVRALVYMYRYGEAVYGLKPVTDGARQLRLKSNAQSPKPPLACIYAIQTIGLQGRFYVLARSGGLGRHWSRQRRKAKATFSSIRILHCYRMLPLLYGKLNYRCSDT